MSPTSPYKSEPCGSRPCSCPKLQPVSGSTGGCQVGYSFPSGPTVEYLLWISTVQLSPAPGTHVAIATLSSPVGSTSGATLSPPQPSAKGSVSSAERRDVGRLATRIGASMKCLATSVE